MLKLRHLFNLTAVFAALTFLLYGQGMTRIEGVVKDKDGVPIQGAEIQIQRTDIKQNMPVIKTDKNGKFQYPTLQKGVYNLVIMSNGAKIYEENNIYTDYIKAVEIEVPRKPTAGPLAGGSTSAAPAKKSGFIGLPNSKLPPLEPVAVAAGAPAAGGAAQPGAPGGAPAMNEAEVAAERARFEKEKAAYEEALAKNNNLQTSFAAGRQALEGRNYDVAISAFTKAGEVDPKQDAVWANLGDAYRLRADAGKGSQRLEDYNKAAEAFGKAAVLKPEDAALLIEQSTAFARGGKFPEAVSIVEKAAVMDPAQGGRGYRNLGAVYFDAGNSTAAEAAFKKSIEYDDANPDVYYQLGLSLLQRATEDKGKLKAPDGTAEAFQEYLALAPTGVNAAEAKSMLEVLGAPIVNSVTQRNKQTKQNNNKAKAKGK